MRTQLQTTLTVMQPYMGNESCRQQLQHGHAADTAVLEQQALAYWAPHNKQTLPASSACPLTT
jgi:hypothetical protein